jgi:CPA1 family monovalent cation:H+ antiporter
MNLVVLAAESSGIESLLNELLPVFIIAAVVGIFVAKVGRFPYTIALLLAGLAVSILGVRIDITLSHDLILLVLLPPLLFEGAATTELDRLRRNLGPILAMAVIGLVLSVTLLGFAGTRVFGFELAVALLFASMVLPTDPVSVLALFEELGAPERLSVLVEGESLVNDGIGVVLFGAFLAIVESDEVSSETLTTGSGLGDLALEMAVSSLGGLLVGIATGYIVYLVMNNLDDNMTETVLVFVLAYGSFLLAEQIPIPRYHFSGVIATVAAGLLIGNRGAEEAMSPQTKITIFNSLETAAFLVNTFIFLMIGVSTPVGDLIEYSGAIVIAIVLVLLARAAAVYPLTTIANQFVENRVSWSYQHVMLWGGLHGSIPIALVLGLPEGIPNREQLFAMVFGVAGFSLVVQGLTMGPLLNRLGIVTRSDTEELYELLVGRARAVDAALEAAERLHDNGDIPTKVYEDFHQEYQREKDELNDTIAALLRNNRELRHEQLLAGERRVLQEEKSAILDAARKGIIADDTAERLMEETNLKLDHVRDGQSTVAGEEEGYEEFWRSRVTDFGLEIDEPEAEEGESAE